MTPWMGGLRVAVLADKGVNEIEFHYLRLRLREAGASVAVVAGKGLEFEGEDHERLSADASLADVDPLSFDAVVLPGGLAPEKLRQQPAAIGLVRSIHQRGGVCAAICHGPQVFLSAGLLRGRRAVAAWSMVDDLIAAEAIHSSAERAVRDGAIVTGRFPSDLPIFTRLLFEAIAEAEGRSLPQTVSRPKRRIGLLADTATDAAQFFYCRYRLEEAGDTVVAIGRKAGLPVRLGSPTWEWGEHGPLVTVEQAIEDHGVVSSDDMPYEDSRGAIRASELDALILPGGLATWLIRGHPGLLELIQEMDQARKPIAAIERGPKILLSAGILKGRAVTGSPAVRDDLTAAGAIYHNDPVVQAGHLITCRGTEDLPEWGRAWESLESEVGWRS